MLKKYETFIVNNSPTISSIESSLRTLTWFLPGRFKDAELAAEALSASLNVLGLYHDYILAQIFNKKQFKPLIPPSPHFRYTNAWVVKSNAYRWSSAILELLRFTELLVEMALRKRFNNRVRWRAVIVLEFLKAILKVTMLFITRRPLLSPSTPEREFDPAIMTVSPETTRHQVDGMEFQRIQPVYDIPDHLKNNKSKFRIPERSQDMSFEDILLPKALCVRDLRRPVDQLEFLNTVAEWSSEFLYIFRPLAYAISLYASDRRFLNPVVLSAGIDLLSRMFRRKPVSTCHLERMEYARRDRDLIWYLLRGDIWKLYTRNKVLKMTSSTSHYPVLSTLQPIIREWISLVDNYFYYSST